MEVPVLALAIRMTRCVIGGRRSHPLVSFFALRGVGTMGRSASAVCNLVATSVRTPVRRMCSCGVGLGGVGRLMYYQRQNQTRAFVRTEGEWKCEDSWSFDYDGLEEGKDVIFLSAMVANVLAVACFTLLFLSSFCTPPPRHLCCRCRRFLPCWKFPLPSPTL